MLNGLTDAFLAFLLLLKAGWDRAAKFIKDKGRMAEWGIAALFLLAVIWAIAPHQIEIVLYKVALVTLFAHLGYWIDRRLFPYARPHDEDGNPIAGWSRAELRRAIIVAAVLIAGAMAL
jgi:hypothetical protein